MYKKLLLFACFLGMITSFNAQTLAPGDIAIIGTNYDVVPYEMTIVNLAPIAANTVIRITDYGYDETTGTFGTTSVSNTSEGSITWTTTALAAGTVTKLTISGGATPVVTGLPGTVTVTGWSNATATNCPVPAGGDNWFIFQGNSPTSINNFIFAWTNTFSATFNAINQPAGQFIVPGSGAPNNNNSYLPPSLTLGSTAIALNRDPSNGGYHGDNNVYTGIFIGTKSQILSEIGNVSKWTRSETVAFNITPGAIGSSFPGINPIFTLPNSIPTDIGLSATAINENVAAGTTVGVLSSVDIDLGNTFTYTLVAGAGSTDNSAFTISGANLQIVASPDFETKSSYSIRLRTADQGGLSFEKTFTINVNNLNEAPTDLALSATAINENVAAGTTVGVLSSVDVDAANTFTYTLVAGAGSTDNSAFTISGANLQIVASPDFETKSSYSIRLRTADQGGLSFEKIFTINVNNLNEVPTDLALSATAINENVAAGTTVGVLSSVDIDLGNTFTYTLVAGAGSTD
ncbi:MAG TPA: cadherin repeat domain-containing protein, partial [Flavobacterium sp.]|uniref:cadherin repeat domain-containing protein n=1 Tax=Flavobacterium sp. TaxID=239 RepID=UPI002ED015D0